MAKDLTPEQSLGIVSKSILAAKIRSKESGTIFIFWGVLMAIASLAQFILLQTEFQQYNYFPYFLFPVGAIATGFYYAKKFRVKVREDAVSFIIPLIWMVIGFNFMILSIGFDAFLGEHLTPVILILLGIGIVVTGQLMGSRLIRLCGLFSNLIGLVCFKFAWEYHGLILFIASILCMVIPGIVIRLSYNRAND
jgi:hypothetical protein